MRRAVAEEKNLPTSFQLTLPLQHKCKRRNAERPYVPLGCPTLCLLYRTPDVRLAIRRAIVVLYSLSRRELPRTKCDCELRVLVYVFNASAKFCMFQTRTCQGEFEHIFKK